jgi:hypothetical protein
MILYLTRVYDCDASPRTVSKFNLTPSCINPDDISADIACEQSFVVSEVKLYSGRHI